MNAYDQIVAIRKQLEEMGASEATIAHMDKLVIQLEVLRNEALGVSQMQIVRHLLKSRPVLDREEIHNDILALQGELETRYAKDEDAVPLATEDHDRHPKLKKHYQEQRKKKKG